MYLREIPVTSVKSFYLLLTVHVSEITVTSVKSLHWTVYIREITVTPVKSLHWTVYIREITVTPVKSLHWTVDVREICAGYCTPSQLTSCRRVTSRTERGQHWSWRRREEFSTLVTMTTCPSSCNRYVSCGYVRMTSFCAPTPRLVRYFQALFLFSVGN